MKLCSGMIEAGRVYVSANKLFVNGIKDLSQQCKKEETISVSTAGVLSTDLCVLCGGHFNNWCTFLQFCT